MPDQENKYHQQTDVLIIGGGFTGVCAAAELARAGVDFHLLEAGPELGGRVKSFAYRPGPPGSQEYHFEHGAQYIGIQHRELLALVEQHLPGALVDGVTARLPWPDQVTVLDRRRYVYDRNDCLFGIGGVPPELGLWDVIATVLLIQEIDVIQQSINVPEPWATPPQIAALDQMTMADWFARPWIPACARSLVINSVQALLSVEPSEISALYFFWYCASNGGFLNLVNDAEDGPQQYYLSTGITPLVQAIAAPFADRVHLDRRVARIEQRESPAPGQRAVKVTLTQGAAWEADKVIIAMSPNTAGRLVYDPPLPPKRAELLNQKMGRTFKCVSFYNEPWWRDSHSMRYTGYAGAESSPVIWAMDYSPVGPGSEGCYAMMTFTVGAMADALGPKPTQAAIERHVTEALAFLFDDVRALSTSPNFIGIHPYEWDSSEKLVGGGPNTVFGPGLLTGDDCAAKLLNEPWNGRVYFASAETARKLAPEAGPTYTPGPDPSVPGTYSDHRSGLGYMEGAIGAGRYVAAQVRGLVPAAAAAAASGEPPVCTVCLAPPELTAAQVKVALTALCAALHAGCAIDVAAWEAPPDPWQRNLEALQGWLAEVLVGALIQSGLLAPPPDPPTAEWMDAFTQAAIALVGAGNHFTTTDLESFPPADRPDVRAVKELTGIAEALMLLKSREPFAGAGAAAPAASAAAAAGMPFSELQQQHKASGRFTSLSRMMHHRR